MISPTGSGKGIKESALMNFQRCQRMGQEKRNIFLKDFRFLAKGIGVGDRGSD
jgi:hypothetical protein